MSKGLMRVAYLGHEHKHNQQLAARNTVVTSRGGYRVGLTAQLVNWITDAKMISTRSSVIRGLVLCAMSLIAHSFDPMGGYTPVSEVGPHSRVALDICKLEELVAANDYTQAAQVFANGLSAVNGDGTLRTLEAMAEKQSTSPVWQQVLNLEFRLSTDR
eukprot:2885386-Pyramimonas_sp.AAC.7